MKTKFIFILLLAAIILSGCDRVEGAFDKVKKTYGKVKETFGKNNKIEMPREIPVFAVNTTLAVKGQISDYISLSGDIYAGSTVDVYSDAAGKITQIYTAVGRRIKKGDRVAAVDPSRPGMTYRQSIATAPISGTVIAVPAQIGMTVSQAVPLVRISGGSGLEIRLNVAERFISKMAMNLSCEITLDAWPGEIFLGSISEISPTVDPVSRTMEVRVTVSNTGSKLKQGMFAKVKIITQQKNNIVKIPATAVIKRFGEEYVYIVEKDPANPEFNVARKRIIVQGIIIDGITEIQSGLAPDEEIVIRGQTLLDDGSRVNVIERLTQLGSN
ncbi:MAG: efflux RND transporter periplasmic adaptor subunit [Spirochaetes bacterium]|nr:efflux RND transporter periplasmic adaptor subunit [Spirochaetota bacterium]